MHCSRLSQQQEANSWISSVIDLYRILVSNGYGMADAGLSECLTLDMQVSQHHLTLHGSELTFS